MFSALQEKHVNQVRTALENAKKQLEDRISQKLDQADGKRQENLQNMLERLKEHVSGMHIWCTKYICYVTVYIIL